MKKLSAMVALLAAMVFSVSAADFNGDGTGDIAIFRPSSGLWAVRGITRTYFGETGDSPVPGDYDGSGTDSVALFRPSSGLWAVRGVTRAYFGGTDDEAKPGDYSGNGTYDIGIFREAAGLWAIKGITRLYFGRSGDLAIAAGKTRGPVVGLPPTGQTISLLWGDDGFYQAGTPFSYYSMTAFPSGDRVVVDKKTGLMWAASYDKEGCNWGEQTNWYNSIWFCTHLEFFGCNDWRLPNVKELQSIVDYGQCPDVFVDTAFFTCTSKSYWTSTGYLGSMMELVYVVSFASGQVRTSDVDVMNARYVRAVRGGHTRLD